MDLVDLLPAELDLPDAHLTALSRAGEGRPIVLVHGAMADAPSWRRVAEQLHPSRPLLVVNRRGRRGSTPPGSGYSVDTEVGDLLAWVDTFPGQVDLVAHSIGGLFAAEAVLRGAPVASLVLYDPVARPFGTTALAAIRAATDDGDLDAVVTLINTAISGYDDAHVERLRATGAWAALRELARPAAAELEAINAFDPPWERYARLDVPVEILGGEHSAYRTPYGQPLGDFRSAFGTGEPILLEGQDHIAHVTAPDLLAETIAAVQARLPGVSA